MVHLAIGLYEYKYGPRYAWVETSTQMDFGREYSVGRASCFCQRLLENLCQVGSAQEDAVNFDSSSE